MNRSPRLPLPAAEFYVHARYPVILGGDDDVRGPFQSSQEARKVARAITAPYPGSYAPSVHVERREKTR